MTSGAYLRTICFLLQALFMSGFCVVEPVDACDEQPLAAAGLLQTEDM